MSHTKIDVRPKIDTKIDVRQNIDTKIDVRPKIDTKISSPSEGADYGHHADVVADRHDQGRCWVTTESENKKMNN